MKKLSFLLALILIFSSISVVPVFAATSYTYNGQYVSNFTFDKYTSSGTTTYSGLSQEYNIQGIQKASGDVVYHVYGTATINNYDIYKYAFNKALKNETDFNNKENYSYSIDVYFPTSSDTSTRSEIVVAAGVDSISPNVLFTTGTFDTTRTYNTSTQVVDGLEKDKWYNITINYTFDGKTLSRYIYIDGALVKKYYRCTSSKPWYEDTTMPITNVLSTEKTAWYMVARPSLNFVIGEKHDFYFDNVIYRAYAFTPDTAATIESAVDGVVTVENDVTLDGIKALATGADAVEIYRENAESTTGYDAITENFATGDIVKLVTSNGSYNYYTLNVTATEEPEPEPENPFIIGDLTSDLDISDGSVSATLELSGDTADKDVTLVVCLYKGITLVEMLTDTISNGDEVKNLSKSITVPTEAGNYTAKAFVWDSLNSMNMLK